jgi:uncharacterized integral membrane protein
MQADIVISIALVAGAVLIIAQLTRVLRTHAMHKTIREAISRDSELTPELIARIGDEKQPGSTDDRTGLVLIALAVAILVFGMITGDSDDFRNLAGVSVFPLFVGAALLGRHIYNRRGRGG